MSFSGLKTALRRERDRLIAEKGGITPTDRADMCAGFQLAIADVLAEKTRRACEAFSETYSPNTPIVAVAGGVAANSMIREKLQAVVAENGFGFLAPPLALCTDNAAMIAWAGIEQISTGALDTPQDFTARPRWPLDRTAKPMLGSGKKGAKA